MKVFVSNFPRNLSEQDFSRWVVREVGISASSFAVTMVRAKNRKSYGIIDCVSKELANIMIQHLNMKILEGTAILATEFVEFKGRNLRPLTSNNSIIAVAEKTPPQKTSMSTNALNQPHNGRVASKLTLCIRNIPPRFGNAELYDLFANSFGIQTVHIASKQKKNSPGFGFVTFADPEAAKNALQAFDGKEVEGYLLKVGTAFAVEPENTKKFVVKASNLPKQMDESQLSQLFGELSITLCNISRNPESDRSLQEGFIEFENIQDATTAVQILNTTSVEPNKSLKGEYLGYGIEPPPPRTQGRRMRPRYKNWRGTILHGDPPPYARKRFPFPLGSFYLPDEYEHIITSRETIVDVQVEEEIKALVQKKTGQQPQVMNDLLPKKLHGMIFHNLLHAEETRMRVDIRQYDLHGVKFSVEKGKYVIQVPGLAEGRPSVLRGDAVKARLSEQYGSSEEHVHVGYAYFVNLDNIHVSFHNRIQKFVERGRKFDVQFTFSRTPIRLCHRALSIHPDVWQKLWASPTPKPSPLPLTHFYGKVGLNAEQEAAVRTILHNNRAPLILHGPPGTGTPFPFPLPSPSLSLFPQHSIVFV
jgi:RNA recognition motif-containing protein